MAVDWGRVRVGVALSDPMRMFASPYDTLDARSRDRLLESIASIIEREEVGLVVVGLPYNMDGSEGTSAEEARKLAGQIHDLGVAVDTLDERLTSFEAEQKLREIGRKPSRDKGRVDRAAAAILLQEYLNTLPGAGTAGGADDD